MRSFVVPLCVAMLAIGGAAQAQTKTIDVRGKKVELQISQKYAVARVPKAKALSQQEMSTLAENAIQAQTRIAPDEDAGGRIEEIKKAPPRKTKTLSGEKLLVPKLSKVKVSDLATLNVAESEGIEPAYEYKGRTVVPTGTIAAMFKQPPTQAELTAIRDQLKLEPVERASFVSEGRLVRFTSIEDKPNSIARAEDLVARASIEWAEPTFAGDARSQQDGTATGTPPVAPPTGETVAAVAMAVNDAFFNRQWYLSQPAGIVLPSPWPSAAPSTPLIVAVIDDGVDLAHEDFEGVLVPGKDFVDDDENPMPAQGDAHGTACAGVIGAAVNGKGVAGVAAGCKIMPIRIFNGDDLVSNKVIAEAIAFAHQKGARVINCSFGGGSPSAEVETAIDKAVEAGCVVIVAAGNNGSDVMFPALYPKCIAVGSLTRDNKRFDYSSYGPEKQLAVMAPSGKTNWEGDIWTCDPTGANGQNKGGADGDEPTGNYVARFGGTSAATPIVSGIAALILQQRPNLTPDQVRDCLTSTADMVDTTDALWDAQAKYNKRYGYGKVNPSAALVKAMAMGTGPTPAAFAAATQPAAPVDGAASPIPLAAAPPPAMADQPATAADQPDTTPPPPTTRPVSETIAGQLSALQQARPVTYTTGVYKVALRPDQKQVLVYGHFLPGADQSEAEKELLTAVLKDPASGRRLPQITMKGRDVFVVVSPKDALKSSQEIAAAVQGLKLSKFDKIVPLYTDENGPIIGTGTLTATIKDPDKVDEAKRFAAEAGFKFIGRENNRLKFEAFQGADPIGTADSLKEKSQFFESVMPDYSHTVRKF